MRVGIVGPGAMGILFASKLYDAGVDVTLVDRDSARAVSLADAGVTLDVDGVGATRRVNVCLPEACVGRFDLVIVLVKASATEGAARVASRILAPEGVALTLQNGVGGADVLASILGPERVLVGSTSMGATLVSVGHARFGGSGQTIIGPCPPVSGRRFDVADILSSSNIPTVWQDDILPVVWRKLAVNCGINAITALLGCKNALVAASSDAAVVCRQAVVEVVSVAKASGIDLGSPEDLCAHVLGVAERTGANRSSMGQDVDRRRKTEIEFINGAVSRLGLLRGVETPVNDTLAALVRALESGYGGFHG